MNPADDRPSIVLYLPLLLGVAAALIYAGVRYRDAIPFLASAPPPTAAADQLPPLAPSTGQGIGPELPLTAALVPTRSAAPVLPPPAADTMGDVPAGQWAVRLFYRDGRSLALGEETRLLPAQEQLRASLAAVAEAWISGPQTSALTRMLPETAQVLAAFVSPDGAAVLDLSLPAGFAFPGGVAEECLALAGLAKSMFQNLEEVRSLRILTDGKARPTLAGHLDTDRTWNRAEIADLMPVPEG